MGARLRLKASVDISSYPPHVQRLFQAMKTYGLIVADNGSDMYVTGTNDPRWAAHMDEIVSAVHAMRSTSFEVVTARMAAGSGRPPMPTPMACPMTGSGTSGSIRQVASASTARTATRTATA